MIGIYKIQSKIKPDRFYIGSSCNIKQRWCKHIGDLKRNRHLNPKLQAHYNKYGIEDLQFSIIILDCKKEELVILEQYFLDICKPWFNICQIANSTFGRILSEETKQKISVARKGQVSNFKGKKHRPESIEKISKNGGKGNRGKTLSEETKQKMRKPHKFSKRIR